MLYVLAGLAMLVVVPGAALAAAVVSARFTARRLGFPDFRLGTPSNPSTRWKLLAIRSASVAGAFFTCFLLAFAAMEMTGTHRPTMIVTVQEGPAREAGVKDGDRIVAIDGKACPTFEVLRSELRSGSGPRTLTLERNAERISLVVTPTAEHRLGVLQRTERRPASVGDAAASGLQASMVPFRYLALAFSLASGSEKASVMGPIGIVKETSEQKNEGPGPVLWMAAILASFVWPIVLLVHVLDAFFSRSRARTTGNV